MSTRRAVAGFAIIGVLFVSIICGALYLTLNKPKTPAFVLPAAWCWNGDDMGKSLPCIISDRQIDI